MSFKVNSLYPFDKAFFGKPMRAWANRKSGEMLHSSNLKMDSIDDLNKHFDNMFFNMKKLEQTPTVDTFEVSKDGSLVSDIF